MKNIRNIVFDYGAVLLDWNPHYVYDPYFGDVEKANWFIANICNMEWNSTLDAGKPFEQGVRELSAEHPEWAKEIKLYHERWIDMVAGQIEGMYEVVSLLKSKGYGIYGLTNWASETFELVRHKYPILALMDGMVVSGEEHCLKPGAQIFNILMKRYSLKPEECVFIDDNAANVAGARAVGMNAIQFTGREALLDSLRQEGII